MTRAQEAEENYVIKRELAVVRQQCSSAAEDLQKAQSTIRQLQEQQVPGRWAGPQPTPCAWLPAKLWGTWPQSALPQPLALLFLPGGPVTQRLPQPHTQGGPVVSASHPLVRCLAYHITTLRARRSASPPPPNTRASGNQLSLQGPRPPLMEL